MSIQVVVHYLSGRGEPRTMKTGVQVSPAVVTAADNHTQLRSLPFVS
jgi:hypothetical protein